MKYQSGTSLIGLMIGLLVSVVGILASLTLYKTLVGVVSEAKADALHDGQLATTLLAIQLKVQNAGFGLNNNLDNILVIETAGEKRLYWRYRVNNQVICEGLRRYTKAINGSDRIAIDYLEATGATCNDALALPTMLWAPISTVSVFSQDITTTVDFNIADQSCSPYGMDAPSDYKVLTLTGKGAATLAGAKANNQTLEDTTLRLCLSNIKGA